MDTPIHKDDENSHILPSPIKDEEKDTTSGGGYQPVDLGAFPNILEARAKDTIEEANRLGYKNRIPPQKAPFNSHGQPVYWNGKNYITPDIDGYNVTNGWKMFDRRGNRIGTFDNKLNRIKD